MGFFKKMKKHQEELAKLDAAIKESFECREINTNPSKTVTFTADSTPVEKPAAAPPEEEWVWVEGFKGTDKNMQAHGGFQYELGVEYNVAEPEEVSPCNYGYHFSLELEDVYKYFQLETTGNRFFKVRALVKKKDLVSYGRYDGGIYTIPSRIDKLAARTIILTEEIIDEETLIKAFYKRFSNLEVLPAEYNHSLIQKGYDRTYKEWHRTALRNKGYSETFINLLIDKYSKACLERALVIADQEGVSMDMKVWYIYH